MKRSSIPHLVIFLICLSILAGSSILTPPKNDIPFVRLGNIQLPGTCTLRSMTGIPCPGCGLLRSLVSAMHGDFAKSWEYHRLGLLTVVYILLQFLYRFMVLLFPVLGIRFSHLDSHLNRGFILLGVLFGVNWIFTLIQLS